jgi:oligosaccharide repeat unit polymerase
VIGCLVALLFLCVANYRHRQDLLYPGLIQAVLWTVVLGVFALHEDRFIPVYGDVLAMVVGGAFAFSVGCALGTGRHRPCTDGNLIDPPTLTRPGLLDMGTVLVTCGLFFFLRRAVELSALGPFVDPWRNLRYAVSIAPDETGGFGALAYLVIASFALAAGNVARVCLARAATRREWLFAAASVASAFVYAAASSGRGFVFWLLVIVLAIPTVTRRIRARTAIVVAGLLAIAIFAAVGILLNKGGSLDLDPGENAEGTYLSFVDYTVGSLPALGTFLGSPREWTYGTSVFRTVLALLQAIGFRVTPPPLVQPFVLIPRPHNLYTVYQPYFGDFGWVGALGFQLVAGLVHGAIYARATKPAPSATSVFAYAVTLVPLVGQHTQDMYFSLLSTWVQFGIYGAFLFTPGILEWGHDGFPDDRDRELELRAAPRGLRSVARAAGSNGVHHRSHHDHR